jgi:hypothetical protein
LRRRVRTLRALPHIEERLVWIFGSPRSGSTWLLQMLAGHPAVVGVNEPLIGWYLGPFLSDLPGFSADGLTPDRFTLRQVQATKRDSFFATEFRDDWEPGLRRLMRRRFAAQLGHQSALPAGPGRTVVAVKEPNGSQSADLIMATLPKSRLLVLLRDGRDVVDSELAGNLSGSWVPSVFPGAVGIAPGERLDFVRQSAHKWLWRTEVSERAYRLHRGPKKLVRYEELRADPVGRLGEIFDWLDLSRDDAQVRDLVRRHDFDAMPPQQRGPASFFRAARSGGWRENLSDEEIRAVAEILEPKLATLGYDPT